MINQEGCKMELIHFHSDLNSQCLVCGEDTQSNYIDLSLVTSKTSQNQAMVRDKLRNIISDKWNPISSQVTSILCIPCFHLIDRYDLLEYQLQELKDDIVGKYIEALSKSLQQVEDNVRETVIPNVSVEAKVSDTSVMEADHVDIEKDCGKRVEVINDCSEVLSQVTSAEQCMDLAVKDANQSSISLESATKQCEMSVLPWQQALVFVQPFLVPRIPNGTQTDVNSVQQLQTLQRVTLVPGKDSTLGLSPMGSNNVLEVMFHDNSHENQWDAVTDKAVQNSGVQTDSTTNADNEAVYDIDPNLFAEGEKLKVGFVEVLSRSDVSKHDGMLYHCCYCTASWKDAGSLQTHVRGYHQPEVLTTQIPEQYGFGGRAHYGVQIFNIVVEPSHNAGAKPFVCIFCESVFKGKSNLRLHYREKHTPVKPFKCVDCSESFRRSIELSRHRVYYCLDKTSVGNKKK